ncbi:MAG: HAMP domain-containing histidine kinase [Chloroflexi bacterium]|nr:HAMP domain-containing histidine kinase [Chloroflexota bacterium]
MPRVDGPDHERLVGRLTQITSSAQKMMALLAELSDTARLQMGEPLQLVPVPTDLLEVVRQEIAECQQTTQQHHFTLVTSLPELIGTWDGSRLRRVFGNLLSNAIKYSPGGGEITVTLRHEAQPAGEWAVVDVRDPGLGIPAGELSRVFERFYRASNTRSISIGSGVGLAGARHIVELHGGTITVESTEGAGATFSVRLPLQPPQERP